MFFSHDAIIQEPKTHYVLARVMRPIYTELEQNLVLCGVAAAWRKQIHAAAAVSGPGAAALMLVL